ncbi:MAG: PqiC family protein [Aliidongia sp.]
MKRSLLSALCSTLLLAACSGSPPTRFFTVAPVAPAVAGIASSGAPIKIASVQVPPSMDRLELVRQSAANELAIDDFAHWAAPLGELARNALTQDLAARLGSPRVIYPDVPDPDGTRRLTVDILSFTYAPGSAVLDVSWSLAPPKHRSGSPPDDKPATPRTVRLSAPAQDPGPKGEAAALSALLGQLADAIAQDLGADRAEQH